MTFTAYPVPRRVSADRFKRIEDELISGGGGGGSSAAPSTRPLFFAGGESPGDDPEIVFTSNVQTYSGEDYWGPPGTAQPLAMTINPTTHRLHYPVGLDDATFDITSTITVNGDEADVGKIIPVQFSGNDCVASGLLRLGEGSFSGTVNMSWVDRLYVGDGAYEEAFYLRAFAYYTGILTAPITSVYISHKVVQR